MRPESEMIAGQGMTDENRVGFFRVEGAVGLIGRRERPELALRIQAQRLVPPEFHAEPVG